MKERAIKSLIKRPSLPGETYKISKSQARLGLDKRLMIDINPIWYFYFSGYAQGVFDFWIEKAKYIRFFSSGAIDTTGQWITFPLIFTWDKDFFYILDQTYVWVTQDTIWTPDYSRINRIDNITGLYEEENIMTTKGISKTIVFQELYSGQSNPIIHQIEAIS